MLAAAPPTKGENFLLYVYGQSVPTPHSIFLTFISIQLQLAQSPWSLEPNEAYAQLSAVCSGRRLLPAVTDSILSD